jgi:aminoglycoside phosphotransferase
VRLQPQEPAAGPWRVERIERLIARLLPQWPPGHPALLAIDGRSSSSKSTLATRIAAITPRSAVVHTDDIAWHHSVLGWVDLLATGVIAPLGRGEAISFRPPAWDARGRPGSISVPGELDLVVIEGVGAARRELSGLVDSSIWVQSDLDETFRRDRRRIAAGEISAGSYEAWMTEEVSFQENERSWERTAVIVRAVPGGRVLCARRWPGAMIDDMREIEVVVAHSERVTLRVGDVFLKIDTDHARIDREVEVMARAPIPTPEVLWRKPPVLALAAVPGAALGVLKEPSRASSAAWVAAGAAVRTLHDAPVPPWPSSQCQQQPALSSRGTVEFPPKLDSECEWLVANGVVSADVVRRNRQVAEAALRPWTPVFIHGDLQVVHVFVDGDEVIGIVDWSEGGQGDAMYDLATLTLAHEERLDDVVAGYGDDIEIDVIRAYWSLRSLMEIRWLVDHGYGAPATLPEVAVLNSVSASP